MADLTGDGIDDLYTGCFEGGVYFLAGSKQGDFSPPKKLLDKAGNILRLGQYWDDEKEQWAGVPESKFKEKLGIGATAVDWDDDGDLDLVLGSLEGNLYVRINEGSREKPAFATESIVLMKDDTPLQVPGGDVIPKIADWDSDGRFDILTGSGEGGAYWLRNVGKKGEPAFETPQAIFRADEPKADAASPNGPGIRTQVCAADYDGDGDLDLLVGDFQGEGEQRHGWVWLYRRR